MKKKVVQYTIADPCHENWEVMTPIEQGRFCNSCAKTVVDFRSMTDFEVMQYMSVVKGSICGKMTGDQLDRDFIHYETEKTCSFSLRALVLGTALSTFSSLSSRAQDETSMNKMQVSIDRNYGVDAERVRTPDATAKLPVDAVFSGRVTNHERQPVVNVKITAYDNSGKELAATFSDSKGNYKLVIRSSVQPEWVVFSIEGYVERRFAYEKMSASMKVILSPYVERMGKIDVSQPQK